MHTRTHKHVHTQAQKGYEVDYGDLRMQKLLFLMSKLRKWCGNNWQNIFKIATPNINCREHEICIQNKPAKELRDDTALHQEQKLDIAVGEGMTNNNCGTFSLISRA